MSADAVAGGGLGWATGIGDGAGDGAAGTGLGEGAASTGANTGAGEAATEDVNAAGELVGSASAARDASCALGGAPHPSSVPSRTTMRSKRPRSDGLGSMRSVP